jgi:hypothetical protein
MLQGNNINGYEEEVLRNALSNQWTSLPIMKTLDINSADMQSVTNITLHLLKKDGRIKITNYALRD